MQENYRKAAPFPRAITGTIAEKSTPKIARCIKREA